MTLVGGIATAGMFAPNDYAKAVELAHEIRNASGRGRWARIDTIYDDGCRVIR